MALALDLGNLEIRRIKRRTFKWNKPPLLPIFPFHVLFFSSLNNHLARIMKQNEKEGGGELFIGGGKFSHVNSAMCRHHVTEPNSYRRLFPQL